MQAIEGNRTGTSAWLHMADALFLALWLPERKQYVRGVILVVPVAKNLQIHQTQSDLTKKTQRHFRPLHVAVNLTKNEHRI